MQIYFFSIKTALWVFPFVAFIIYLPMAIYQYRRHNQFGFGRALIYYSFILYLLTAFFLVILPLPSKQADDSPGSGGVSFQLRPFQFIRDIGRVPEFDWQAPSTYHHLLRRKPFMQMAFNALLLLPLGVFLRGFFRFSFRRVVFVAFVTSLFFEITQGTAFYGYYRSPYRIFDVDDLISNTLGACLGYLLAPMILVLAPKKLLNRQSAAGNRIRVGLLRRFAGFAVDYGLLYFTQGLLLLLPRFIQSQNQIGQQDAVGLVYGRPVSPVFFFFYFVLAHFLFKGRTIGGNLVGVKLVGRQGRGPGFFETVGRALLVYAGFFLLPQLGWILYHRFTPGWQKNMVIGASLLYFALILNHMIAHCFAKNKKLYFDRICGTDPALITLGSGSGRARTRGRVRVPKKQKTE